MEVIVLSDDEEAPAPALNLQHSSEPIDLVSEDDEAENKPVQAASSALGKRKAPAPPAAAQRAAPDDDDDDDGDVCVAVSAPERKASAGAGSSSADNEKGEDEDEDCIFEGYTGDLALADFPRATARLRSLASGCAAPRKCVHGGTSGRCA